MGRIVELKKTLQKLAQSRTWEKDFAEAMLLVQRGATIAIRGFKSSGVKNHAKRYQKSILIRSSLKMSNNRYLEDLFRPKHIAS